MSVLECVWGLCSSAPLKSYASILDQLGSLCKGLVRVGGQLERDNPYALHRLQVRCYSHHQIFIVTDSQIMNGLLVSDSVQGLLTNLCQDSSLDIVLRLQILEVGFYFESDAQFLACRVSRWSNYEVLAGSRILQLRIITKRGDSERFGFFVDVCSLVSIQCVNFQMSFQRNSWHVPSVKSKDWQVQR